METVIVRGHSLVFLAIAALSARTISALALQKNSGKLLNAASHPDESIRRSWDRAAGLKDPEALWVSAVVPYTISANFDQDHINLIKSAMDLISQKSCIIFKKHNKEPDSISIETGNLCSSEEGRIGGNQVLLLETPGCGDNVGVVIHELLHALGLVHEQTRPDRNRYVKIVKKNIQDGEMDNFKKLKWDVVQNLTIPYDLTSVMHYYKYAFSKNGKMTIIPKGNGTIPDQVNDLSAGDAAFINFMYCNTTKE